MQRKQLLLGLLGLLFAATAAHAQTVTQVTLFGQKYNLERHNPAGKYKNGLSVTAAPSTDQTFTARFVADPGGKPENDRLFVGGHSSETAGNLYDQFYQLTGADPTTGQFNTTTSNLVQYFGGAVDFSRGGRISGITYISDVNTGKQKDFNIALTTYTGNDALRFYDFDTLSGDYIGDAVLSMALLDYGGTDFNQPATGILQGSVLPDGNVLFIGRERAGGPGAQLGVFDIKNRKFFPVLTNVEDVTQNQSIPYDQNQDPYDLQKLGDVASGGAEYLILGANPNGRASDRALQILYKAIIVPPKDLVNAGAGSIQVQMEAQQILFQAAAGSNPAVDPLGVGLGGIVSVTAGRPVAPTNALRLYFTTRTGDLITANPVAQ